jgi:SM-20-related protein
LEIHAAVSIEHSNFELIFEELIDSYLQTKVGVCTFFLPELLASNLTLNLLKLHESQRMRAARTGNENLVVTNLQVRGDEIYWLDRKHEDPFENEFLDLVDLFILYLNRTCYAGITGYEFHYTLYKEGAFYKRHLDQFMSDNSRQFSMISYLNNLWKPSDGGELLVVLDDKEMVIEPTNRKTVFFKSNELEHEVLTTYANRLSITGWLKKG